MVVFELEDELMAWVNRPKTTNTTTSRTTSSYSPSCNSTAPESSCSPQTTVTTRRCLPLDNDIDNNSSPPGAAVDVTTALSSLAVTVPFTFDNNDILLPIKASTTTTRRGRTNTCRIGINSIDSCTKSNVANSAYFVEYARLGRRTSTVSTVLEEHEKISNHNISNLPWRDNYLAHEGVELIHGQYSGPINDKLQPHGDGILMLGGNNFLKFHGHWVHGELVTFPGTTQRLLNEDEKIEYDKSARSARIFSDDNSEIDTLPLLEEEPQAAYEMDGSSQNGSELSRTTVSIDDYHASMYATFAEITTPSKDDCKYPPPRQKYRLGEVARTPRHMIIHKSNKRAIQSLSTLQKLDQAFIKRSNGLW